MEKLQKLLKVGIKLVAIGAILGAIGLIALAVWYFQHHEIVLLAPKGTVADHQRNLLIFGGILSLFVVLPVYWLTFYIVWKYREGAKKKASYMPDWDFSRKLETTWLLIPLAIITLLSIVTWKSSHDLDPYKPLASDAQPLTIQVVALQWK